MNGVKELLDAIQIMIDKAMRRTTETYFGTVISVNTTAMTCSVSLNGLTHTMPYYGATPVINRKYPVTVPQGNLSVAYLTSIGDSETKVVKGSYTGTGSYGSGSPNSIAFDFTPKIVFISRANGAYASFPYFFGETTMRVINTTPAVSVCTVTITGNTMKWYSTSNATAQLNTSGVQYDYVAIG